MVIRRIVLVIGALIALIGLSQIAAANWWLRIMPSIMQTRELRILGIAALVVGVVLTFAGIRRLVGLWGFVLVLGVLMLVGGAVMLLNPAWIKDTVNPYFLNRPHNALIQMAWAGGAARVLIGALLISAASRGGPRTGAR